MKPLIFAFFAVFTLGSLGAQTPAWQPSPGHTQVPIWPDSVPDAQPVAGPEVARRDEGLLIAGRPVLGIDKVSHPTLTVYSPNGRTYCHPLRGGDMHIVIGFINIILGRSLAGLYRGLRLDFIGSSAVRRCCAAFSAGAGLDDGAIDALRQMGPDGARLLESEVTRTGEWSTAGHVLKLLRHEADEKGTS